MGKRGPAPSPTPLKIIKGEKPSRINRNEPKPDPSPRAPSCPAWLSKDAKAVWGSLAPQLHTKGVLTEWDRESFAVFCEAVVHHREACKLVDSSAILINTPHGLTKNPALQIVRDQASILRGFAQEFGLTPSSRSGIEMPHGEEYDAARRLLS